MLGTTKTFRLGSRDPRRPQYRARPRLPQEKSTARRASARGEAVPLKTQDDVCRSCPTDRPSPAVKLAKPARREALPTPLDCKTLATAPASSTTSTTDVSAEDVNADTPLHMAARKGSKECFELLVAFGANPGAVNRKGIKASDEKKAELINHSYE